MKLRMGMASLLLLAAGCAAENEDEDRLLGYGEARYLYVAAQDAGRIESALVQEGDAVKAGATLFRLDPERLALNAQSARAEAAAAESRARANGALAQAAAEARAQAELAQASYARSLQLFEQGFLPQARLDADRAALDAANAAVARAEAERTAAQSQSRALGSAADLAGRRVSDLDVVAPADGVIERVYRRPGEIVAAGEPLAAMIAPGGMRVRFFAPQALLARLSPGARVGFACDGCADGLTGRVSYVAAEPEFTPPVIYSREEREKLVFLVEATPDDPRAVRPGLPVEVWPIADAAS